MALTFTMAEPTMVFDAAYFRRQYMVLAVFWLSLAAWLCLPHLDPHSKRAAAVFLFLGSGLMFYHGSIMARVYPAERWVRHLAHANGLATLCLFISVVMKQWFDLPLTGDRIFAACFYALTFWVFVKNR